MTAARLPAAARPTEVALNVADLARASAFYHDTLGLGLVAEGETSDGARVLALGDEAAPLLYLVHAPRAPRGRGTAGLYHFAMLYPDRRALAETVYRVLALRWPLTGAADHDVSEAVYLSDPEGNGVELYRDRPREAWSWEGGALRMGTGPLDVRALLAEAEAEGYGVNAQPILGHVHLHVGDLAEAERFYDSVVGLDRMLRYGDSASFLSAGGYHHHIGVNTWGTEGASPADPAHLGLAWYRLGVGSDAARSALGARLQSAGWPFADDGGELRFQDPAGHLIRVGV